MRWLRGRLGMLRDERGSALVEFVFIALVVFVPLVYVVAGFSAVQRGVFASTAAAREAGRAIGTAPDVATGRARAEDAARIAVEDQAVEATDMRLAQEPPGASCDAAGKYAPTLTPGGSSPSASRRPCAFRCSRSSSMRTPPPGSWSSNATATSTAERALSARHDRKSAGPPPARAWTRSGGSPRPGGLAVT